ncbi:MAG: HNH endonuclease, partial [Dehalococcoidia bacterium]
MAATTGWTRQQLLVALNLYCQIPFGKITSRNPEIVKWAALIGRTPAALSMKMGNIASLDPAITSTGRSGLENASAADKV